MDVKRQMAFQRYGRCYHLLIDSAEALRQAAELDEAHWVATSAQAAAINGDRTFLRILDADGNGRITCGDLKDAIGWLLSVLSDHDGVDRRSDGLAT